MNVRTHPTSLISILAAIGKTVPPTLEPVAVKPSAIPRLFLNQCEMTLNAGAKIIPQPNYALVSHFHAVKLARELTPTAKP